MASRAGNCDFGSPALAHGDRTAMAQRSVQALANWLPKSLRQSRRADGCDAQSVP